MESFLRAVGLKEGHSLCEAPKTSKATGRLEEMVLPDLAQIAASTERAVLQLEEEARSLEKLMLVEAQELLQRWTQALKRRPKDETVTFKAQFLRSNALEKALEALRKNERLKQELLDRPLFAAAESKLAEVFRAELRSLLQACLPKYGHVLVEPTMAAVFDDELGTETHSALMALRSLKEDWREVVRLQAARRWEMRYDSLTYQLQKMPEHPSSRRLARERIQVLVLLLEGLVEIRSGLETHGAEIDSALTALGLRSPKSSVSSGGSTRDTKSRSRGDSVISGFSAEPSEEVCAEAMESLATKTEHGVRRGLGLLGLPERPLHFVPGAELRLRGHDVRVAVCGLLQHWVQGEKQAFFETLARVKHMVSEDGEAEALERREELRAERRRLQQQLLGVEEQLEALEEKLRTGVVEPVGVAAALPTVAAAVNAETRRQLERLGAQLQQRRTELILALSSHLEAEAKRLQSLAVAGAGAATATELVREALQTAAEENRQLVESVQRALKGHMPPAELCSGGRCRARWMDGNYYDATIHAVLPGGFVVVNWLRPRAHADGEEPPIRAISGVGGDDTLHRIVQTADVEFDALSPEVSLAFSTFRDRAPQDRTCVECGAASEWASVSFGTYLCSSCAEEHLRLGPSKSLVRQLNDGWGWTETELKYMAVGGNEAFRACMDQHPVVKTLSLQMRYSSRFAEYYRRSLDALCIGAQRPQPPNAPEQPGLAFASKAEACALALQSGQRLEEAAQAASAQCGPKRSCSLEQPRDSISMEAPRSVSEMQGRRRKVSC